MNPLTVTLTTLLTVTNPSFATEESVASRKERINLSYDPNIQDSLISRESSFFGCKIENYTISGKDPITSQPRNIAVSLYLPKQQPNANGKVVILLPPTGGVNILDRGYANEICQNTAAVALVNGWDFQNESSLDFDMHNNGALRSLATVRQIVSFLENKKFSSIGFLGTSVGAIIGTLAMGFEPRIQAYTLIVGSAKFRDVIAESDEESATQIRKLRMEKMGLTSLEEYRQAVYENVWVEPMDFLQKIRQPKSFLISADRDATVPTKDQLELASHLQPVTHLLLNGDHLAVIKAAFFRHRREITSFFAEHLH